MADEERAIMDRRRIWLVIIAIVIAGVSITWATEKFVSSHGVDTAAVVGFQAETQTSGTEQPYSVQRRMKTAERSGNPEDAVMQTAASEAGKEEETDASLVEAYAAEAEVHDMGVLAETIKSPLEPDMPSEQDVQQAQNTEQDYGTEKLKERLEHAGTEAAKYKDEPSKDQASRYAAAEYVWNLWDRELNLIYSRIREKMDDETAENFRKEEMEWLKKRDLAADKAGAKVSGTPGQNTEYVRTSAEKTKDRCYELLETYGELLDGTTN